MPGHGSKRKNLRPVSEWMCDKEPKISLAYPPSFKNLNQGQATPTNYSSNEYYYKPRVSRV